MQSIFGSRQWTPARFLIFFALYNRVGSRNDIPVFDLIFTNQQRSDIHSVAAELHHHDGVLLSEPESLSAAIVAPVASFRHLSGLRDTRAGGGQLPKASRIRQSQGLIEEKTFLPAPESTLAVVLTANVPP